MTTTRGVVSRGLGYTGKTCGKREGGGRWGWIRHRLRTGGGGGGEEHPF